MVIKQLFGLVGSIILFVGIYVAFISTPIIGNIDFFQNGKGYGGIILVLALISLIITLTKRYKWLFIPGLISLCITIYSFLDIQITITSLSSRLNSGLKDIPLLGLGDLEIKSMQILWGWAILTVGSDFLIASSILDFVTSSSWFEIKKKFEAGQIIRYLNYSFMVIALTTILFLSALFYLKQKTKSGQGELSAWHAGRNIGKKASFNNTNFKQLNKLEACEKLSDEYFNIKLGIKWGIKKTVIEAFKSGCETGYTEKDTGN